MNTSLKVGVLGYGRIGKIHLDSVRKNENVDVVSVCDPQGEILPKELPGYSNYRDLIAQERPDAVVICTPTPTHVDIISYCAERGVHVFCEKPLDLDIGKIQKIQSEVEQSGITVMIGFNRRFDPDFALLKKNIDEGVIGAIHQVTFFSRDPALPSLDFIETSGGLFMDMTIHDFDMSRFITGSEVKEVYAKGQIRVTPELSEFNDIDTATVVLTMENETTCTIQNSRDAGFGYDMRIEVFGSKGMIMAQNNHKNHLKIYSHENVQSANPRYFFLQRFRKAYQFEIDEFIQCILNNEQPSVGIHDALKATQIAQLANQSLNEGRIVKI